MKKINVDSLAKMIKEATSSSLLATPDRPLLKESSLSRVHQHMVEHDTAVITAFRDDPGDLERCIGETNDGEPIVDIHRENKLRNRNLKATLLSLGYGVTRVDGSYIEDFNTPQAVEVAEESFFVVNLTESSNFFKDMVTFGEQFCQDSVLLIPKGGSMGHLVGTNNSEFPGYKEKISMGNRHLGEEGEFMTRVKNRPFLYKENLETYKNLSRSERMAAKKIAERVLNTARSRAQD
jgi:hypothetical protein